MHSTHFFVLQIELGDNDLVSGEHEYIFVGVLDVYCNGILVLLTGLKVHAHVCGMDNRVGLVAGLAQRGNAENFCSGCRVWSPGRAPTLQKERNNCWGEGTNRFLLDQDEPDSVNPQ